MSNRLILVFLIIVGICLGLSFSQLWAASSGMGSVDGVEQLSTYTIKTGTKLAGVPIGGLSEIEFSSTSKFIALSDARSTDKGGPSRFYTGKVFFKDGVMKKVELKKSVILKKKNGNAFNKKERDPESFVYTKEGNILMASEGSDTVEVVNSTTGVVMKEKTSFLPKYYYGKQGLRGNQGMEGMSLSPDGSTLFIAVESALVIDGEVATEQNSSLSRIIKFKKKKDGYKAVAEYAYEVSKIPTISDYGIQDNGVSAILALDKNRLLLVERNGYAVKKGFKNFNFNIRVYLVDFSKSDNVLGKVPLNQNYKLAKKKLLVNLSDFTERPDNVEGIAWGPSVRGKRTIILVSDNNFLEHQATKFYQLAIPEIY